MVRRGRGVWVAFLNVDRSLEKPSRSSEGLIMVS